MKTLQIAPNKPLTVALADPEGEYDFDNHVGQYQTTTGDTFTLPRNAVILLNELGVLPNEEITITQHWSGRASDKKRWTVALAVSAEKARAEAGEPDTLMADLEASLAAVEAPTPIRAPKKEIRKEQAQPRLFDQKGTGTYGPVPQAAPAVQVQARARNRTPPDQIPANVAVAEILSFIAIDSNTLNWGDQAKQDLASTIIIAAYKAGHIGLWERYEKK